MKFLLLGTSGYHPNERRHTACFMLPELGVVFDAGSAMFRVADHLVTDTLDVFLTHAHLDHVFGLSFMFDILAARDLKRVTVHGEAEKIQALRKHLFDKLLFPVEPPFEMKTLTQKFKLTDGGCLTHFPLKHPGGSIGFRLDWPDRSLAYVTDTTAAAGADYIDHIRGVDVLLHECHFGDDQADQAELTGHSCLTPVAQVAAEAGVGRLVLVHLNPLLAADTDLPLAGTRKIFANTKVGTDGMVVEF